MSNNKRKCAVHSREQKFPGLEEAFVISSVSSWDFHESDDGRGVYPVENISYKLVPVSHKIPCYEKTYIEEWDEEKKEMVTVCVLKEVGSKELK